MAEKDKTTKTSAKPKTEAKPKAKTAEKDKTTKTSDKPKTEAKSKAKTAEKSPAKSETKPKAESPAKSESKPKATSPAKTEAKPKAAPAANTASLGGAGKVALIAGIAVVAIIAIFCAYFSFIISSYSGNGAIAKGITISGVDVGGMTITQACEAVEKEKAKTNENVIDLVMDDQKTTASFSEFSIEYNTKEAAKKALAYGKSGNIFTRFSQCMKIKNGEVNFDIDINVNTDDVSAFVAAYAQSIGSTVVENSYAIVDDKLHLQNGTSGNGINKTVIEQEIIEILKSGKSGQIGISFKAIDPAPWDINAIYEDVCTPPSNASHEVRDGKTYIVQAKNGYGFEKSDLENLINTNKGNTDVYVLPLKVIEPEVTTFDDTGLFSEVISEYKSSLAGSDANRRNNVDISCRGVNGTILNPGDVFSYNKAVGPVTYANGYRNATIFTTNGHEPGLGGGICQLSSTLYSACLYGNMEIVNRRNHMYLVGYVPYGQDATVYEPSLDFQFRNNTNEPLKITAEIIDNHVVVKLLGKKPDPSITIEIKNVTRGAVYPTTVVKEDPTKPVGYVSVTQRGQNGLVVDSTKYVYKDGKLIDTIFLHTSTYRAINRVEVRGTAQTAPTQTTPETPTTPTEPTTPTTPTTPTEPTTPTTPTTPAEPTTPSAPTESTTPTTPAEPTTPSVPTEPTTPTTPVTPSVPETPAVTPSPEQTPDSSFEGL